MQVHEKMRRDPITVTPDDSAWAAWELMRKGRIRHLPVLENGRLVGIVSDHDFTLASGVPYQAPGDALGKRQVGEIMSREIVTVTPDVGIDDAAWLLLSHGIGSLPVVWRGVLVGLITETDLLQALVEIFRLWSPDPQVELVVEARPEAIAVVSQIVRERRGKIIRAVAAPLVERGRQVLVLPVRTPEFNRLLNALREAGHPALATSEPASSAPSSSSPAL